MTTVLNDHLWALMVLMRVWKNNSSLDISVRRHLCAFIQFNRGHSSWEKPPTRFSHRSVLNWEATNGPSKAWKNGSAMGKFNRSDIVASLYRNSRVWFVMEGGRYYVLKDSKESLRLSSAQFRYHCLVNLCCWTIVAKFGKKNQREKKFYRCNHILPVRYKLSKNSIPVGNPGR